MARFMYAITMFVVVVSSTLTACGVYVTPDDSAAVADASAHDVILVLDSSRPPPGDGGLDLYCVTQCSALCARPDHVSNGVCYCNTGDVVVRLDATANFCGSDAASSHACVVGATTVPDAYCRDTICAPRGLQPDREVCNVLGNWDCVCGSPIGGGDVRPPDAYCVSHCNTICATPHHVSPDGLTCFCVVGNTVAMLDSTPNACGVDASSATCTPATLPCTAPGDVSFTLATTDCRCQSNCVGHGGPRQLTCNADHTWSCICNDATAGVPPTDAGTPPVVDAGSPVDAGGGANLPPDAYCTSSCHGVCALADHRSPDGSTCFCLSNGVVSTLAATPNTCVSPAADAGVPTDSGTTGSWFVYRVQLPSWALAGLNAVSFRDGWYRIRNCREGSSGEFRMAGTTDTTHVYYCSVRYRLREFTVAFSRDPAIDSGPCRSSTDPGRCSAVDQITGNAIARIEMYELRDPPDGRRFDNFSFSGTQPAVGIYFSQSRFIDPAGTPTDALP